MPSVCLLILVPKMGIMEAMKLFSPKGQGEVTCTIQEYLPTAALAPHPGAFLGFSCFRKENYL